MRLERLTLAPYGRFADRSLEFRPDARLHVVLGANESGKTTTLAAIGDLLFGFPTQTPYAFAHDMRLLRVGGDFSLADNSRLRIRRRKGAKNTLIDDADQPLPDDALQRALGAVDRRTFESEFGLTAQALREGGAALLAAGGGLAESLAAGSAGLSALTRLKAKLAEEADQLFTPRRSSAKPFYVALDRHDEAEKRLREAIVTTDALKAAEDAVLGARAKEIDLKAEHEETGRALARLQRAQRTFAKLTRLSSLAQELEAFADLPGIAPQTLADWRAALADDNDLRMQDQRLGAEEAEDEAAIGALHVDPALLDQGEAIDALREKLGAVRKAKEDLPRRIEAHGAAQTHLDELAARLGFSGHAALLAAQPTDPAIARAKALIEARRRAHEKHRDAVAVGERAHSERDRLRGVAGADAANPEPLKRRLATLAPMSADADRLRRERAACEAEARLIDEDAARLVPNAGTIDELAKLALPDEASLAAQLRAEEAALEARRAAEARLNQARRALETSETSLARHAADAAGATRADWIFARERREAGFERLAAALDGEARERRERLEDLRSLTLAADALADSVLADSERAARLQAARDDFSARREELQRAEAEFSAHEAARAAAQTEWRALWAASKIIPLAPAAMARWRERAAGLIARRAELAKKRAELESLEQRLEAGRAALVALGAEFGLSAPAAAPFDAAYREAQGQFDALQSAWMASREIEIKRKRAESDAAEAETAVAREAAGLASFAADWPDAMAAIGLGGAARLEEAEAALEVWGAVALPRLTRAREARSILGIEEDISAFEAGVAAVVVAAAPALAGGKAEDTLAKLAALLAEARRAAGERERLRQSIAKRGTAKRGLAARRAALAKTLADASAILQAESGDALAARLERLEQRQASEAERARLRQELPEIADGLDEAALRAEQAELDMAVIPGRIDLARQRQGELLHEIGAAAGALREAETRLGALSLGRGAAGAARERQEASAELIEIAEKWVLRQAAAKLAARAIERHRAAAEDPLIARAGKLFAIATANSFTGLGADYDNADRPVLVARREGGERVRVEGLSEGARDQLFLSLRLALLERRAGEPLPFIGDDILASFDDERAKRTLGLLAEFGKRRQVIVFTHHRHVAELARGEGGDFIDVMEL